jgi:predicted nucleotidyltransferase
VHTLSQLLERLAASEIEFVVIGGYAAVLHGSSQVTQDLDICAILSDQNIDKLREALGDLDPRHRMTAQKLSFLDTPPPGTKVANLYLRTKLGVVDILTEVLGVGDFDRLKSRAQTITLGGNAVRMIALDDLITAKEALARDKDLITAKELRLIALRRP